MKKLTTELVHGDKLKFANLVDTVVRVELPEPPCVVAKVITKEHNGWFLCGVKAEHEVM